MNSNPIFFTQGFLKNPRVGISSLIGPGRERPTKWGNYYWLEMEDAELKKFQLDSQPRVVNMWAENMTEAVKRFCPDNLLFVRFYAEKGRVFAVIHDPRIPEEWYYHKPYFVGGWSPSREMIEFMFHMQRNWKPEDVREWTDTKAWHEEQGHKVHELPDGSLQITIEFKQPAKPLLEGWTFSVAEDIECQVNEGTVDEYASMLIEEIEKSRND